MGADQAGDTAEEAGATDSNVGISGAGEWKWK